MRKKNPLQQNLFGTATISKENGGTSSFITATKSSINKKRNHIEDSFRKDIEHAAKAMDLPCIHIEYFCGNKFVPRCERKRLQSLGGDHNTCGGTAVCNRCGQPILAHCRNTINRNLKGQMDIIGVAWGIETKQARNKKGEAFKPTPEQLEIARYYESKKVPVLVLSTAQSDEAIKFLREMAIRKHGKDPLAK